MRTCVKVFGVLLVSVLVPSAAHAQASIAGVVRDTSGAVLPGVTVEAASPVLIEKVRTTVTDGNGRFQIVDLRPGSYSVTFTLPGFNAVRRDGITLSGANTSTVDAELRVGSLEETITVTGEAPTVDVQTTTRQSVLDNETIAALPTSRNYATLARLIPGTNSNVNDVGGSAIQDVGGSTTIHGSKNTDQRVTLNGINTMTLQAGGNIGGQIPDVGSAAEITVDTSSLSAEMPTGGVRINFVPKDGGNTFSNSTFLTFSNDSLAGDNFSDELRAAGLGTPNKVLKNFDLNESFGGPFKRDRVWFWFSTRYNFAHTQAAVFRNRNEFNPNEWLYVPDTSRPGVNKGNITQNSIRVTWQASAKHKIAGTYKVDRWCNCPNNVSATVAPEAGRDRRFPRLRQEHLEWTSPLTNRVLVEAVGMHLYERWGNMHYRVDGGSLESAQQEQAVPLMISVVEQTTGMRYRSQNSFNNTAVPNFAYRAAMSYVTGTHNVKVGFNRTHGYQVTRTYNFQPVEYRFNNGVPNQVTVWATPFQNRNHLDNDLGFFAQDRWTLNRTSIGLAIRYDYFGTSFPEQTVGPSAMTPNRNITFPELENTSFKDLTYRMGLSYDIFGTGKTALKLAANKYLLGQTLNGIGGASTNPIQRLVNSTNRSWNDANRNFVPDCVLTNPAQNGECGPLANQAFGTAVPGATYDPDLLGGFGNRQYNWEFSAGVQHELIPRVSLDVGYFRRVWGNFAVTDNLLLGPQDFDYFSMTAPRHPELPGGGGYTIEGLRNVKPAMFGRVQDFNTLSDKFGKQIEHWNGFDITVNARLQNGLTMQAGTSTGRTTEDNCEVVAKLPEMDSGNNMRPLGYCHRETPWQTQFKGYAVYTVPRVDVQVSGTLRSTLGNNYNANFTATNAILASSSTLGRPLSGNAANISIALLAPNSTFIGRRNELDLRFGKIVRVGRIRNVISLDLFNALNSDALISVNQSFASWLRPTEILNARLMKVSYTLDF
ncbi:MAG: TonB-dependent receptor [Acidimicrobiia bacterium]|nr:TonB-dependent receptor [Acidimicrobiia bacterium]